jgi:hypothetical protein
MQTALDTHTIAYRLPALLDELSADTGFEYDPALDDLEREFAEIRLGFRNGSHH